MRGRGVMVLAILLASSVGQAALDWNALTGSEKIIEFLATNVTGKTFQSATIKGTSANEKFDYEYSKKLVISSVGEYENGVKFAVQSLIRQNNTRVSDKLVVKKDRAVVLQCEIGERLSTRALLGFCRTDIAGASDPVGQVYSVIVDELTPKKFSMQMREVFYSDANPTGDEVIAVSSASDIAINVDEGGPSIKEVLTVTSIVEKEGKLTRGENIVAQVPLNFSPVREN